MNETQPIAYTPEQVAERIGAGATPTWVRMQPRSDTPHLRDGRGRLAFTDEQIDALIKRSTRQEQGPAGDPLVTSRSAARGGVR